jgi:hypothetical protein
LKFTDIITNPPYGELHTKIAKRFLPIVNSAVFIQPRLDLERAANPLYTSREEKMISRYIFPYIKSEEIIPALNAQEIFETRIIMDLAIVLYDKDGGYDCSGFDKNIEYHSLLDKITRKRVFLSIDSALEKDKLDGIRVYFQKTSWAYGSDIWSAKNTIFINGYDKDKKWWGKPPYINNQYTKEEGTPFSYSLPCKSMIEAENIVKTMQSKFETFCFSHKIDIHIYTRFIPFPIYNYEEAPITDEFFYDLFKLKSNEIKLVEDYYDLC